MSNPLQIGIWLLRRLRPLFCTLAFSRPDVRSSSFRVPQFRMHVLLQPLACLLYAGCLVEEPSLMCKQRGTHTVTVWSSVSADCTCSNSRRFRRRFLSSAWVAGVALGLSFGSKTSVHYPWASHLEECRSSTHATSPSHRSPDGPFQATRSPVKGRTPQLSVWHPNLVSSKPRISNTIA